MNAMDPKKIAGEDVRVKVGRLRMNADAFEKLTLECGDKFDAWQHFSAFEESEEGAIKTGYQVNVFQFSRKHTNKINQHADSGSGIRRYLKVNPEQRFTITVYQLVPEGVHYLSTLISMDAGGGVLSMNRTWSKKSIPLHDHQEKPRAIYSNDPFTDHMIRNSPLKGRGVQIPESAIENAAKILEDLSEAIKRESFEALPVDDHYCMFDPTRKNVATFGYSRS